MDIRTWKAEDRSGFISVDIVGVARIVQVFFKVVKVDEIIRLCNLSL